MELEDAVIRAARAPGVKSVMLLGRTDAGKTTIASMLGSVLSKENPTGLLDLDMGQARVGPPTTISWGIMEDSFNGREGIKAQDIYFTGALSPPGNMLPGLTGAALLMDRAMARCEKLIIDTTGLVTGPAARAYKLYKIDLLKPDVILAVQEQDELEHILSPYRLMDSPVIIRIKPSPLSRVRSMAERADFRAKRLKTFFEGSRVFEVDLEKTGVRSTNTSQEGPLEGRLISFRDSAGADLSLGVIEKAGIEKSTLLVRSPLSPEARYACVVIGSASMPLEASGPKTISDP
ncbi:MAG: hypothetical protein IT362_04345 [Deltaproteobacteria bacterium]|nr:hypothetical protein [Deltaproteobacteria bacterium]